MDYKIILYIVFGILPSLTWLLYYLRKDVHPEPKKKILQVFLWGALSTVPVFFVQIGLAYFLSMLNLPELWVNIFYWFFVISFTEEYFKYLVIKTSVLSSADLDEPVDIMLYMVIAALGFAALENILYLFSPADQISFNEVVSRTLIISFVRFLGATFLHTLCSAVIGYFLALYLCEQKKKPSYIIFGMALAIGLHGLYDFSIMTVEGILKLAIPVFILITLASIVFWGFNNLRKMNSTCKLQKAVL